MSLIAAYCCKRNNNTAGDERESATGIEPGAVLRSAVTKERLCYPCLFVSVAVMQGIPTETNRSSLYQGVNEAG